MTSDNLRLQLLMRCCFDYKHGKRTMFLLYDGVVTEVICRGILFDLDGVLADSTPAVERVWHSWAVEHGFVPAEVVRRAHGRPSMTTIRELLPDGDHEKENREVERREIADTDGVVPLPGALELLQALPQTSWSIVTSCTRALALVRIAAAGLPLPKTLVTSTDVTRGKPDPEPYLKGAEFLGFPAADCVVVEDAPAGIRAGKAAGARVLALRTTAPDEELTAAGADWIVQDLSKVKLTTADGSPLKLHLS
jgi:mannitol-1-/sugar-/sorbitol-6-phosphatase